MIQLLIRARSLSEVLMPTEFIRNKSGINLSVVAVVQSTEGDGISNCKVISYDPKVYNYSEALNAGFKNTETDYVLVCSSHSILKITAEGLQRAESYLFNNPNCAAISFVNEDKEGHNLEAITNVSLEDFDGFNGLNNSCSLIRRSCWEIQQFDEAVFCVEDQIWTACLLKKGYYISHWNFIHYSYMNKKPTWYKNARDKLVISQRFRPDLRRINHLIFELIMSFKNLSVGNFSKSKSRVCFVFLVIYDYLFSFDPKSDY